IAADFWSQAEGRKKARGHLRAGKTHGILFVQVAVGDTADRAHGVEDLVVFTKTLKISFQQELAVVDGSLHPEPDQPVLMGIGEIAKQDAVDDAEDRRDSPDSQ